MRSDRIHDDRVGCPLCGERWPADTLEEALWLSPRVLAVIESKHPRWRSEAGACPPCVQQRLLEFLRHRDETPPREEASAGVLPTPSRMQADPRWTGRGLTLALVDSGFHPHPDLTRPRNRIRAFADAGTAEMPAWIFDEGEQPAWPGSSAGAGPQWHGLMTSAVAAGNGWLSHGFYRGLASETDLVLVAARDAVTGRINNETIARALGWLLDQPRHLRPSVVSVSLGGEVVDEGERDEVSDRVAALVEEGITVIAAAGNDGQRRLLPPGSSPHAITVGGLDDRNAIEHPDAALWHSNYGTAATGAVKPEVIAPSIWVVAPLLPGTSKAMDAASLFATRNRPEDSGDVEERLAAHKFVSPHYHHVDGTSVAAPLVASVVVCMLQANPRLTPAMVRAILRQSSHLVPGGLNERQGAGALDAGKAVALAREW